MRLLAEGAANAPVRQLYVRDGQLLSWDFRLYVAPDLPPGVKPRLCLFTGHLATEATPAEQEMREPRLLAYGQKFAERPAQRRLVHRRWRRPPTPPRWAR